MNSSFIKFYNKDNFKEFKDIFFKNGYFINERKDERFEKIYIIRNDINKDNIKNISPEEFNYFIFLTDLDIETLLEENNLKLYLNGVSGGFDASPYYTLGSINDESFKKYIKGEEYNKFYDLLNNKVLISKEEKDKIKNKITNFNKIKSLLTKLGINDPKDFFIKPQDLLFGKNILDIIALDDTDKYIKYLEDKLGVHNE